MGEIINNEPVKEPVPVSDDNKETVVPTPAEETVAQEETEAPAEVPVTDAASEESVAEEATAEEPAAEESAEEPAEEPASVNAEEFATKESIIERLKQIAESNEEISRQEVDSLKNHFYRMLKMEGEAAHKKYLDEGGDP